MPGALPTVPDQSIAIRVVLLALLLAAVNLWSVRHLGFGLEDPIGLLGLTGGMAAFSFVLDYFISEDEQKRLAQPIRSGVQRFLRQWILATPTLTVLYLVCGIAVALFSSITVAGAKAGPAVTVEILALDDPHQPMSLTVPAGGVAGPVPYLANPFGRELRVSPAGYSSQTMTLYPLGGLTLDLNDFEPLPTLLLRPGPGAIFQLDAGARYLVWKKRDGRCVEIANTEGRTVRTAATIGVRRAIPAELPPFWRLELQGAQVDDGNAAKTMLAWQRPQSLTAKEFIEAGNMLRVEIWQKDKLVGFADHVVTAEPFQDIPLIDGKKDIMTGEDIQSCR